jgi:hypothetical protein
MLLIKSFFRAIIGSLLIMEKKIQDFQDDAKITHIIYYTLHFYFPYLSLLVQPVNITGTELPREGQHIWIGTPKVNSKKMWVSVDLCNNNLDSF